MESDFSFPRNLMERKWKPSNSLKRCSESWKQKIIPTENWKNYVRHLASSFIARAAGIFVSLRSTDGFINCSPQYKNSTEFVLRKKVKLNRINYQHMFIWTRCLLLSMSKVFTCQAGAARFKSTCKQVKQVNKITFYLSHSRVECLLFISFVFMTFTALLTTLSCCERHNSLDVGVFLCDFQGGMFSFRRLNLASLCT